MSNLEESKPKSAQERIHRRVRITGNKDKPEKRKSATTAIGSPNMNDRIAPIQRGRRNDPRRNNPWVGEACEYIVQNHDNPDAFDNIEESSEFLEIVEHMIAVRMGGWQEGEDVFVNESGRTASPDNWNLMEDGRLTLKSDIDMNDDTDWLHAIREKLENE